MALDALVRSLNDLYRLSGSARVHADTVRTTGVAITQTGLRLLQLVQDHPRISATDLAAAADVSPPTASRVLPQLEQDRYVERLASDRDGRLSHYVVTAAGTEALATVHGYHVDRLSYALGDLEPRHQEAIAAAVSDLVTRLHAAAAPASRRTA